MIRYKKIEYSANGLKLLDLDIKENGVFAMGDCVFCNLEIEPDQKIILSNEYCLFLQLEQSKIQGSQLEGAGVIIPKKQDRKSTRLNSSHVSISYAVFCLKKKK